MKWEYRFVNLPTMNNSIENILNSYGEDGWELVSSNIVPGVCSFIFKKPKEEEGGRMRTRTKL